MGLLGYKSSMKQARDMLEKGLITVNEFTRIEAKMCEIFGINIDSIYRENEWTNSSFRGNITPTKEVIICKKQ